MIRVGGDVGHCKRLLSKDHGRRDILHECRAARLATIRHLAAAFVLILLVLAMLDPSTRRAAADGLANQGLASL